MYSKETENLKLPQWLPNDHPDFLTDMNNAYKRIDEFAGSMDYINEPLINDIIAGQDKLKSDMIQVKDDIKVIDGEVHEIQEKLPILEDRIQHEHEKNDEQDVRIDNLQESLHGEIIRATNAEENLQTNINAEVDRAIQAEDYLQQNINSEANRATAEEERLSGEIERLSEASSTLIDRVTANEENITKEHQTNDQQTIAITELTEKTTSLETNLETIHNDVVTERSERQTDVADLNASIASVTERVTEIENNFGEGGQYLTREVADETYAKMGDLTSLNGALLDVQEKATQNSNEISSLDMRVASLEEGGASGDFLTKAEADEIYATDNDLIILRAQVSGTITSTTIGEITATIYSADNNILTTTTITDMTVSNIGYGLLNIKFSITSNIPEMGYIKFQLPYRYETNYWKYRVVINGCPFPIVPLSDSAAAKPSQLVINSFFNNTYYELTIKNYNNVVTSGVPAVRFAIIETGFIEVQRKQV